MPSTLISDNHNHILYDGLQSMVRAAADSKNVGTISITEHISQFEGPRRKIRFGSFHRRGRLFADFSEYLLEFEALEDHSVHVRKGLEVDFSPSYAAQVSTYVAQEQWDILLCSVHELGDGLDIEHKHNRDQENSEKYWKEYMELQKQALRNDSLRFQVLTHPVRLAQSTLAVPSNIDEMLLELASLAREEGKSLELNGNDLVRDYALVEKLALACSKIGCSVSFGSDAHRANEVTRGYEKAHLLMQKLDLREAKFT